MIVAAQPALFDKSIGSVGAAVWAVAVHQPECAAQILIKSQIFAQQTYRLDGLVFELAHRGYRHPVTAQQVAHRSARADCGEKLVLRTVEHFVDLPPQKYIVRYNRAAGTGKTWVLSPLLAIGEPVWRCSVDAGPKHEVVNEAIAWWSRGPGRNFVVKLPRNGTASAR